MTIVNTIDLATINLSPGSHNGITDGACIMELVAFAANEDWSDTPACASPVIGAFSRRFWDNLDDAGRLRLAPYYEKILGTNTGRDDDEQRRALALAMLVDLLPAWLDAAGMTIEAAKIRALPADADTATIRKVLRPMYDDAWRKRNAIYGDLRTKVRAAVRAELAKRPAAAAEAEVAAAAAEVAAAVVAVVAEAVAVAVVAEAAEAAAAAEVAAAVVAVVAEAVAVVVVAEVAAADDTYWKVRSAVREAVQPIFAKAIAEHPVLGPLTERSRDAGFELLDAMCAVGRA